MTALKRSCEGLGPKLRHQRMPVQLALEHADKALASVGMTSTREPEPWVAFVHRIKDTVPGELRPRELKRLTDGIWCEEKLVQQSLSVLTETVSRHRKSFDRTVIRSYLNHFPTKHPSFDALRAASELVAARWDWPWQSRGDQWALWDRQQGPTKVATGLLATDEPHAVLRSAGLDADLASGRFLTEALIFACRIAARVKGTQAEGTGDRLVRVFSDVQAAGELKGVLAYALLAPWVANPCSKAHERKISRLLVTQLGDPRTAIPRWSAARVDASALLPEAEVDMAFSVLRRWLVQATVRQFFAVVAQTTDRKDQWAQRTKFWLGYLDADVISDAWFAFGTMAERLARRLIEDETVTYAKVEGGGADPSHSALIFTIGDVRIAEWSHNGRARFWKTADRRAPVLYRKKYDGHALRAMSGGAGFEALSHTSNWEPRFARQVYKMTGVRHPQHGAGW